MVSDLMERHLNKACTSYAVEMFNLYAQRNEVAITHHPSHFPSSSHLIGEREQHLLQMWHLLVHVVFLLL